MAKILMLQSKKSKILHFSAIFTCICQKNVVILQRNLSMAFTLEKNRLLA